MTQITLSLKIGQGCWLATGVWTICRSEAQGRPTEVLWCGGQPGLDPICPPPPPSRASLTGGDCRGPIDWGCWSFLDGQWSALWTIDGCMHMCQLANDICTETSWIMTITAACCHGCFMKKHSHTGRSGSWPRLARPGQARSGI